MKLSTKHSDNQSDVAEGSMDYLWNQLLKSNVSHSVAHSSFAKDLVESLDKRKDSEDWARVRNVRTTLSVFC